MKNGKAGKGLRESVFGYRALVVILAGLILLPACGRKDREESEAVASVAVKAEAPVAVSKPAQSKRTRELGAVLEQVRISALNVGGTRLAELFKGWAGEDLAEARAAAAGLTDFKERLAAHEGLLAEALAKNPKAAVEWLHGLEPKGMAEVLLDAALADWAGVDAAGAGKYVVELGTSDYRTVLAGELARAWAAKDGPAAMAWGASLQDQEAREEALTEAVHTVAAVDARAAADMALGVPHAEARTDALELSVIAWWDRDPAAVTAWAAGIKDAERRAQAERLVAAQREAARR